jgi:hypothetical protein
MFEVVLQSVLATDSVLTGLVSVFNGAPSVFSEEVPESVSTPYIVHSISRRADSNTAALEDFTINVDYYDRTKTSGASRERSRSAAQRIEFLLDNTVHNSSRYDSIRIMFESGGPTPDADPRDVHYNLQFSARAGRKAWGDYTNPN